MLNRREWLRQVSAVAALPLLEGVLPADLAAWGREVHAAAAQARNAAALDGDAMRQLALVCERIIPADDTPGAIGAGVPRFVDHMLANWYDPPERERVVTGLRDLDRQAALRIGGPRIDGASAASFAAAPEAQQDAWLLELDALGAKSWFATVKYLTIWGYYTSEVGVKQELRQWPSPGRYDGCAPYEPRTRSTAQAQVANVRPRRPHVAD